MDITFINFGGFFDKSVKLENISERNGYGKTTIVNGLYWLLTGRTLNGFIAERSERMENAPTRVTMHHPTGLTIVRETKEKGGTRLYINGTEYTNTEAHAYLLEHYNYDTRFAALCCDVNRLCDTSLTSDELRTLFADLQLIDGDDVQAKRKRLAALRTELKNARSYAALNVCAKVVACQPVSVSEHRLMTDYVRATHEANKAIPNRCVTCGQFLDKDKIKAFEDERDKAKAFISEYADEFLRLSKVKEAYDKEQEEIRTTNTIIERARKAREDVLKLEEEERALTKELMNKEFNVQNVLEGLDIITSVTAKNGTERPTFALTYKGLPLASVNRSRRMAIMLHILDYVRTEKGMQHIPILIDNAEAMETELYAKYENVITFKVKQS